jgi:uroporphyrin-III C-methyltransferase/precorrin-2 dehydrogenase/sirohydrochlorin ferrochelatase
LKHVPLYRNPPASDGGLRAHTAEIRVARMEPLARLPLFFDLNGRRVTIAGDKDAAAWKAELLSAAGAIVDVFAPNPAPTLLAVASQPPGGAVHLHHRAWRPDDLKGAVLAIGAFEDERDAIAFTQAARDAGVLVNLVDRRACVTSPSDPS